MTRENDLASLTPIFLFSSSSSSSHNLLSNPLLLLNINTAHGGEDDEAEDDDDDEVEDNDAGSLKNQSCKSHIMSISIPSKNIVWFPLKFHFSFFTSNTFFLCTQTDIVSGRFNFHKYPSSPPLPPPPPPHWIWISCLAPASENLAFVESQQVPENLSVRETRHDDVSRTSPTLRVISELTTTATENLLVGSGPLLSYSASVRSQMISALSDPEEEVKFLDPFGFLREREYDFVCVEITTVRLSDQVSETETGLSEEGRLAL